MTHCFYWFSYYIARKFGRDLRIHQLRDGAAFAELATTLSCQGYKYGGVLLNYPAESEVQLDTSFLDSSDFLVLTTRPPLDDKESDDSKRVERSNTSLEVKVFAALRNYFSACTRSHIILSSVLAKNLPAKYANRANIQFRRNGSATKSSASITEYSRNSVIWEKPIGDNLTMVYLLHTPPIWENGPQLIACFGMAGVEGLIWAHLLRTRFSEFLISPRFIMAEMSRERVPEPPYELSFADGWEVDVLFNYPLT